MTPSELAKFEDPDLKYEDYKRIINAKSGHWVKAEKEAKVKLKLEQEAKLKAEEDAKVKLLLTFFYLFYHYNNGKTFVTADNPYNPDIGAYLSVETINYFLVVLALFQCLLCIWLKDIVIAVHKALTSSENLEDHRSDSDE